MSAANLDALEDARTLAERAYERAKGDRQAAQRVAVEARERQTDAEAREGDAFLALRRATVALTKALRAAREVGS